MLLRHELSAVEARRFLQSLPRAKSRTVAWAIPAGRGLRLSSQPGDAAVCLAGPERLRLLERSLPFARTLRVFGPEPQRRRGAEASGWELVLDGARVVFVLSPELYRGFSGEGGVLRDLAQADDEAVDAIAERLHGEPEIEPTAVAEELELPRAVVWSALGALGAAGRVGFDIGASSFFHRELPYERSALEAMHPRLLGAQQLVDEGAVFLGDGSATVTSGDADHLVRWDDSGARCTCAWFARHRGQRGACKHVLAVELVRQTARVT
jgi:SWIM zinc finger